MAAESAEPTDADAAPVTLQLTHVPKRYTFTDVVLRENLPTDVPPTTLKNLVEETRLEALKRRFADAGVPVPTYEELLARAAPVRLWMTPASDLPPESHELMSYAEAVRRGLIPAPQTETEGA